MALAPSALPAQEASALSGTPAAAESPAPSAAASEVVKIGAFVWSASPTALPTGALLGGGVQVRGALLQSGGYWGARLALARTSEASRDWQLTHLNLEAAASVGVEWRRGVGALSAQLSLGGLLIRQLGQRQQYDRLLAAGVADLRRDGWSLGPFVGAELGAEVAFYSPWSVQLRLGPGFTMQNVAGARLARWFLSSGLGVGRAF